MIPTNFPYLTLTPPDDIGQIRLQGNPQPTTSETLNHQTHTLRVAALPSGGWEAEVANYNSDPFSSISRQ
ncbi:MAG TPA: hypothetical protein DCX89_00285 [Saprospirales bacterium]|nr:hypothetical protein [Saprospirales bacterium]HAY70303.1 hypothetical protein [Saprospirales bacterium]